MHINSLLLAATGAVLAGAVPALKQGDHGYGLTAEHQLARRASVSSSQYWHEMYHGFLSMAIYGDYETTCPDYFTEQLLQNSFPGTNEKPWLVLNKWGPTKSGMEGFEVIIPMMDKVVSVLKGPYGWQNLFNHSAVPINPLVYIGDRCANCTVHEGAAQAYKEVKEATNDFQIMKDAVKNTKHQWSVTGHGFAGMVAQVAALDLGWRGLCHWSHNHGSSRVFNKPAADLYNSLFQGEAGQRTVANNDYWPNFIPESANYTHTLQGFHVFGTNKTYGMSYAVCNDVTNPECLGGNSTSDHEFYYTPIGMCGKPNVMNETQQENFVSQESASWASAHSSTPIVTQLSMPSSATSSSASTSSAAPAGPVTGSSNATTAGGAQASGPTATPAPSTTSSVGPDGTAAAASEDSTSKSLQHKSGSSVISTNVFSSAVLAMAVMIIMTFGL